MIIIENQPFPLINWIKYSFQKEHIILLSCEGFRKMTFRNRFIVAGGTGLIPLSTPLVLGRNQKIPFKDVRISYQQNWQLRHWRTLTSCYNKSPFFEYYKDGLEIFFMGKWQFLFDWNMAILGWLKKVLIFPAEIIVAEEPPEDAEDLREKWLPKNFQNDTFEIVYPQVFENKIGFQKNLSILDLLFNMGPHAADILKSSPLIVHSNRPF